MMRFFLFSILLVFASRLAAGEALIIDHNCLSISEIPRTVLQEARKKFKVAYGHTSHGSQLVAGMHALKEKDKSRYDFNSSGDKGALLLWDKVPSGDLGNPDRRVWAERTWELLKGHGAAINVVMWAWCGQVETASSEEIDLYLGLMNELEKAFPNVTFIYMTGHLNGTGFKGNLHARNQQIREYCRKHGKILFDFADIESYDPDGKVNYNQYNCRDNCSYYKDEKPRNWAEEWLKNNPRNSFALPARAAHTSPLSAAMKGQAFWYMLARLTGWKPECTLSPKKDITAVAAKNRDVNFKMPLLRKSFSKAFKFDTIKDFRYWQEIGTGKSLIPDEENPGSLVVPVEKRLAIALLRNKYFVNEFEFKADLERGRELYWFMNSDFKNNEYAGTGVGGLITPYLCRLIVGNRSYDLPFIMPELKTRKFHCRIIIKENKLIWGLNNKIVCEKVLPAAQLYRKGRCGIGGVKSRIRIGGVYVNARY
ncbi:hypothetical protein P0136_04535 [Lentisphaerota bacterium ZTH]|nr:hypothetical protein JYG24_04345 [Lentisphaerota bacterium]WET07262.1 hypothetical protein P0136_04535 [Lentisphaerota bacterium ZTH]